MLNSNGTRIDPRRIALLEDIIVAWLNKFHQDMADAGEIIPKMKKYSKPSQRFARWDEEEIELLEGSPIDRTGFDELFTKIG